jgi:2,4-dienoyl-CoA reductase-like NADH-dependent reductase (Old Yellow Enzyme family)/thioredoxin reductase
MSIIQSLMGRRQFLIATGMASTCLLTCKKLAGFGTQTAIAAEQDVSARIKAAGNRCPHLLSPLKIRDRVLKNRIMYTVAPVFTFQGPENFPSEAWRNHYSNMAKNAAIVTTNTCFGKYPKKYHSKDDPVYWSWEHISNNKWEDIPPVYNYVERMIEDIHCEGALILNDGNSGFSDDPVPGESSGLSGTANLQTGSSSSLAMPPDTLAAKSVEDIVQDAKDAVENGYDAYQVNANSLKAAQAVRSATNLIIMADLRVGMQLGAVDAGKNTPEITGIIQPTAAELEQFVEQARKFEGLADFITIRSGSSGPWVRRKDQLQATVYYSEAVKKAGLKILTCINGALHDPVQNDELIAKGKTDMVGMTRPFLADEDLVRKVSAGMTDDIIPCTQCQNCHAVSMSKGPHYAACTVNPKWAAPAYKLAGIKPPLIKKKVAVIGGGPAGMKAALTAAERGHRVTLYEKDASLGGLQRHLDYTQWNWGYKLFKDWLINQVKKAGIEVSLNTAATPSMIRAAGYDTVLVAVGAEVVESKMKGADAGNVFNILTCYSNKKALGKNVVMVGAGKFATEAAICMVKDGHRITVLAPGDELIDLKDVGPHNAGPQERIYKNHPDFKYVMKTTVKGIAGGEVTYMDEKGAENSIQADSVVVWSGLRPRNEEAVSFFGSADEVLLLGDCTGENGRVLKTIRSAFYVASQV